MLCALWGFGGLVLGGSVEWILDFDKSFRNGVTGMATKYRRQFAFFNTSFRDFKLLMRVRGEGGGFRVNNNMIATVLSKISHSLESVHELGFQ